ncbi:hypothetical protein EJ05DRAFT_483445 [Pseudovirgaria hyperparasitica]|uniref:Uncharacterized protein n=1 Tax=Pseudovirgaria hyperparasitica TaxID=470096 RepID=A0A6A6WHA1_9PEZI|nr:uncharacterized protein EJ05DRAFT_483445 [Pseudovirgaria hyperparasitica]KAF2761027.1 hypothetical protein EJ05DRAFT_483445 [Pseudovirgaria hyperparasitica]
MDQDLADFRAAANIFPCRDILFHASSCYTPMHTCFASVLTRALKISPGNRTVVLDFLAPTSWQHLRRFASTPKSQTWTSPSTMRVAQQRSHGDATNTSRSKISKPPHESIGDVAAWVSQLELFVPSLLHVPSSIDPSDEASQVHMLDLARFLIEAEEEHHINILSYLGVEQHRWTSVSRIVKSLLRQLPADGHTVPQHDPLGNIAWPLYSLDKATGLFLGTKTGGLNAKIRRPGQEIQSLDDFTDSLTQGVDDCHIRHRFMGLLWKSLGKWILRTAEDGSDPKMMVTVRQLLADLYHMDYIPEQVHKSHENEFQSGLTQSPLLHLFSSTILISLSNAKWEYLALDNGAMSVGPPKYILGVPIPGTRYKAKVEGLSAGVWLELVLWSCVYGGWIHEATEIVIEATSTNAPKRWTLARWHTILESAQQPSSRQLVNGSSHDNIKNNFSAGRTISSEVVANLIHGLLDTIECDTVAGKRTVGSVTRHIRALKRALDEDSQGMDDITWDTIIARILETERDLIKKNPRLALDIATLSQTQTIDDCLDSSIPQAKIDDSSHYISEPSGITLGIYHSAIRSFAAATNAAWASKAFIELVRYMDVNKKRTVEAFFRSLKTYDTSNDYHIGNKFASAVADPLATRFEYIPYYVLRPLLDIATQAGYLDFGRWLLTSMDVDGPVIGRRAYVSKELAAAIVRFGAAAQDRTLLQELLQVQSVVWGEKKRPLSKPVLSALLIGQVSQRRWASVRNILQVLGASHSVGNPDFMASMVKELILHGTSNQEMTSLRELKDILLKYCLDSYGTLDNASRHSGNVLLAILATVDPQWNSLANALWRPTPHRFLETDIKCFNSILDGVIQSYGVIEGQELINRWCLGIKESWLDKSTQPLPDRPLESNAPKLIIPPRTPVYLEEHQLPIQRIRDRWRPNVQTIRILWRAVHDHAIDTQSTFVVPPEDKQNILDWCREALYKLGLDPEHMTREMQLGSSGIRIESAWDGVHVGISTVNKGRNVYAN